MAPDVIGTVPMVEDLPVATFPERGSASQAEVLCARWRASADGSASTSVLMGDSLPLESGDTAVNLAQADGRGNNVDSVFVPHGRSAYVRACAITGDRGGAGSLYVINDSGVAFGVHDDDAAKRVGLTAAVPAPWPVLARLPRGPELSVQAASVVRDGIGWAS